MNLQISQSEYRKVLKAKKQWYDKYLTEKAKAEKHSKPSLKEKKAFFVKKLKPFFSMTQIHAYLRGKWLKVRNWPVRDISIAMTLKSLSPRAYRYLRSLKILPMPGERNLRRYFQHFKIREGHLDNVHELAKIKAKKLEPKEKLVKLNFDAVHFKFEIAYDATEEQVVGPNAEGNLCLMEGVESQYKIPVLDNKETNTKHS